MSVAIHAASVPPTPSSGRVIVGALYYLGLSVAAGTGLLSRYLTPAKSEGGVVIRRAFRLGVPAAALVAATGIVQFLSAAAVSAKTSIGEALDRTVLTGFVTAAPSHGSSIGAGKVALIQMGVYLLLLLALLMMSLRGSRGAGGTLAVLVLGLGMLMGGAYNTRVLLPKLRSAREVGDRDSMLRVAVEHFPKVVVVEALLAVAVLFVVPFFAGSARAEAGWPTARSFDMTVFGTGAILVAVAMGLWAGARIPNPLERRHA